MKRFFARIVNFLLQLFSNKGKLNQWIYDHVQPAIEIVQKIKSVINSPAVDVLTAIIPGELDNKIKNALRKNIAKVLDIVAPIPEILNETDLEVKLDKFLKWFKKLSPTMQKGAYMRIASEMASITGNAKDVKGHSVDLLTQLQYSKMAEGIVSHEDVEPTYCNHCGNPQ